MRWLLSLAALLLSACGTGDASLRPEPSPMDLALRLALREADVARVPPAPPEDPALVELGRLLFFDKILSGNQNISCATCHHPVAHTGDDLPLPIGEGGEGTALERELGSGRLIPRNAPAVFNGGVPDLVSMFWDSRVVRDPVSGELTTPEVGLNGDSPTLPGHAAPLDTALAAQAMFPVTSNDEMLGLPGTNELADAGGNAAIWQGLMERLGEIPEYVARFREAFPETEAFEDLTFGHAARAIAAFESDAWRALDTPFDRYLAGDAEALTEDQKRGALLFFGSARCAECHRGPLLTDLEHHAVCVPQLGPGKGGEPDDRGLALLTGDPADDYRFRTPPLRNVAITGPWMHDGAFLTLEDAVRHQLDPTSSMHTYDPSVLPSPWFEMYDTDTEHEAARAAALDPVLEGGVTLSDEDVADLVAFLHALTDPASLDLSEDVPSSVPSGLPVAD